MLANPHSRFTTVCNRREKKKRAKLSCCISFLCPALESSKQQRTSLQYSPEYHLHPWHSKNDACFFLFLGWLLPRVEDSKRRWAQVGHALMWLLFRSPLCDEDGFGLSHQVCGSLYNCPLSNFHAWRTECLSASMHSNMVLGCSTESFCDRSTDSVIIRLVIQKQNVPYRSISK